MTATILALDASSTSIGWVLYDGAVLAHGAITLAHDDLNHRCRLARASVGGLLILHPDIDAIGMETPGGSFVGTVIPQCYVQGAIRCLAAEHDIPLCDVSSTAAKRALTKSGAAQKDAMLAGAASAFGYDPARLSYNKMSYRPSKQFGLRITVIRAWLDGVWVYDEHQADALGIALVAAGMVRVIEQVAA